MKSPGHLNDRFISTKKMSIGLIWLVLFITTGFFACKKISPADDISTVYYLKDSVETGPVNIYLAGWRSYYPSNEVATYWKNGVLTDLTDGSKYITANSIAVSGYDIYVGGNQYINNHFVAKYWKNGTIGNITDTSKESYISAVTVSGNDTYFAGYENDGNHKKAKYWKNGRAVSLTSGSNDAELTAITVTGGDVYAAGWESNGTVEVAKYWKNGIIVKLSDGSQNTEAVSIAVSGKDVYVLMTEYIQSHPCPQCGAAGAATAVSMIWENGSVIKTAGQNQFFSAIAVHNNTLYIAGVDGFAASYFKNDVAFHLTDGSSEAAASGIALWGADVYVTGYENILGHNVPTLWKNGSFTRLTDGTNNTYATAIYLGKQ